MVTLTPLEARMLRLLADAWRVGLYDVTEKTGIEVGMILEEFKILKPPYEIDQPALDALTKGATDEQ